MAELEAHALTVRRAGGVLALDGVEFAVRAGELVAVMGATGSGKSTLALALTGLVEPSAGRVGGAAAGDARLVLQRPEATFLEARVLDEVSLAARRRGEPLAHAERAAHEALARLGLPADMAGRDPLALSGGEQRRVAIAAVLAADPRVLLLDEPGAGLDAAARDELHDVLRSLHAAGRTMVLVTHDPHEAALLATRLVVLAEGRVAWDGDVAGVLGDPARARSLGLAVSPAVDALHRIAAARGVAAPHVSGRDEDVVAALAELVGTGIPATIEPAPAVGTPPTVVPHLQLPPLVDARVRLLACALAVVAALRAETLLAAAIVAGAIAVVVALARIDRTRVRIAVRPLIALTVALVLLQLVFRGGVDTDVTRSVSSELPALAAILRALQAAGVVLATLALSGATATTDLAAATRWLLRPLGLLRVPVDSLAFVVATGLGLVPTLADELERLRLAQRARGIRRADAGVVMRVRDDAQLLAPLFVAAFRRAHLLADALAVRGFDPRARGTSWRPRTTPASDWLLAAGGVALLLVSRFA